MDVTIPSSPQEARPTSIKKIIFKGKGNEFFSVYLLSIFLSIVTLGIYYPWARVKILKYLYNETELEGSSFTFHGIGKEIFIGMLKALTMLAVVFGIYILLLVYVNIFIAILFYLVALIFIGPAAVVGSLKYRASRSSWRGIYFGYRGTYKSMFFILLKGLLLTIITFGIYGSWFTTSLYKEILKNLRMGNLTFNYRGQGEDLFVVNLKGIILTYITLGIYFFKYQSDRYKYLMGNINLDLGGQTGKVKATTTGFGIFKLAIGNLFIVLFSLGLAMPWAIIRTINFYANNSLLESTINFDEILQTETDRASATGEGLLDSLDALDIQVI